MTTRDPAIFFSTIERALVSWWEANGANVVCEFGAWHVEIDGRLHSISEQALAVTEGGDYDDHEGLFKTGDNRATATALRRLLPQIEGLSGADGALGADVWRGQDRIDTMIAGMRVILDAITRGTRCSSDVQPADIARAITAQSLRVYIAKLEERPA